MKAKQSHFNAIFLAFVFTVGLTACKSLETNAYRTIGMTQVAAKGAMEGWRDYVATGKATKADEDSVRVLWAKYQEASTIAEKAQRAYSSTKDASQLQAAASVMALAGQDLIEFIYRFVSNPAKKGK